MAFYIPSPLAKFLGKDRLVYRAAVVALFRFAFRVDNALLCLRPPPPRNVLILLCRVSHVFRDVFVSQLRIFGNTRKNLATSA